MNLFELFAKLVLDSSEYEGGLNSAEKSTQSFGSKLKSGLTTASKVAAGAVTAVAGAGVALGATLVSGTQQLAQYGDNIDKMSQKLGLSNEAYQEWDYVLGQAGTSIDNMSVGLKTLTNKIDDAKNGSADAQKMFEKLGISTEALNDMSREDVFASVISGFQGMADSTERAALANDLFGRSGQELTPLFNSSIEDTEKLRKASRDLGFVLSGKAVKASADYNDALDTMQRTIGGVKNNILDDMLPAVTSLMEGFTGLIAGQEGASESIQIGFSSLFENLTGGMAQISTMAQTILPAIVTAIIENLPMLAESVIEMLNFLGTSLIENAPLLITSLLAILQSIGNGIIENLPILTASIAEAVTQIALMLSDPETLGSLLETVLTIMTTLASSLIENVPVLIDAFMQVLDNIITFVVENLPLFVDAALQIITALSDGLIEALPDLLARLPEIIEGITAGLLAMLPIIVETGVTLITALITDLPVIIQIIVDAMPEIINSIVSTIVSLVPQLVQAGITLLTALVTALPQIIQTIVAALPQIVTSIVSGLLGMLPELVQAGITLLTALIDALPTIIITIATALPQIITAIVSTLTGMIPEIVQAGITLLTSLVEALPEIIQSIVQALPEIITAMVTTLTNMIPEIVQAGVTLLTSLVKNLPQIIATIVTQLPQIVSSIVTAIIGSVPQLINAGSQLIQGLWQGIANVGEWLREKVSGFFGGVVQSIKDFFGIHSPSTVFAGIGEMLDKGLAKGIGDYAGLAVDEAADMAEDVFGATDRDFNFTGTATGAGINAQTGRGLVINVYGSEGQDVNELAELVSQKIAFGYAQERAVWA